MRFGVNILNFGPGANPNALKQWAQVAEAVGYDFAMISDHVTITPDVAAQYPEPFYDPFVSLAWLAGQTRRIELGTTVTILPYRHPLQTARIAANIDHLSGGRLILGVGVGWAKEEFATLGVPFEKRGALTNRYLETILKCWATEPRPLRAPHPPIWVGGSSEAAIRRAVRYGDAWHPIRFQLDWLEREGLPALRRIAEEEGKPAPAFCPRIKLASLEQARADIDALERLGASAILFDTYAGKPESTLHPEKDWELLIHVRSLVM
jgi:alkanesulfonate monooxygenase SsuD/methylene tetrahydromethanopterin reductase-like flavin-dependent oxidoreductase (luciferase family)